MLTGTDVLIVGAGPAGSACAGVLKKHGVDFILTDKQPFPRNKICAGWITPDVFRVLSVAPVDYPFGFTTFHHFNIHLRSRTWIVPVLQYAIRRMEFDNWLLEKNNLHPVKHEVKKIEVKGSCFVIDDRFRANRIVGAGGDRCPVSRTFFSKERLADKRYMVVALEKEFKTSLRDDSCHLWFRQPGLPGYAWYVPKAGGYLNIGLGAFAGLLVAGGGNLNMKWKEFLETLRKHGLYEGPYVDGEGYRYRIRKKNPVLQKGNIYITGDAAGLATKDMGEGIGPAIESGIRVARAIVHQKMISTRKIRARSFSVVKLAAGVITGKIERGAGHKKWINRSVR